MEIGMLWFDDGPGSVKEKVARAADFYLTKYGQKPTVCMVHPNTLGNLSGRVGGVELVAERSILPDHFWIGVEETPAGAETARDGNGRARQRSNVRRGGAKASAARQARSRGEG